MNSIVIQALCAELQQMRRSGAWDRLEPHKLPMLLSVLDLVNARELQRNQIIYGKGLRRQLATKSKRYARPGDVCQPSPPFFHLRNSTFRHRRVRRGREDAYAQITRMDAGASLITGSIEYAYSSPEVYEELEREASGAGLRVAISRMRDQASASLEDEP